MGTHQTRPYKGVVTPGWTLDEKGQAMSKSRGNDVDPVDISSRLGGEIVRLWVASVDFREDVVGSEALMQRVGENYKKIRNTLRYVLGNLGDFDPAKDAVPFNQMEALDQYMLGQTASFAEDVRKAYDLSANCYVPKPRDLDEYLNAVKCIEEYWLSTAKLAGAC